MDISLNESSLNKDVQIYNTDHVEGQPRHARKHPFVLAFASLGKPEENIRQEALKLST